MRLHRHKVAQWKFDRAIYMRLNPTKSERILWEAINHHQLGVNFHRQKVILGYIGDFYCPAVNLIIEVDGDSHINKSWEDFKRDSNFKKHNFHILRFSETEVFNNIKHVQEAIIKEVENIRNSQNEYDIKYVKSYTNRLRKKNSKILDTTTGEIKNNTSEYGGKDE